MLGPDHWLHQTFAGLGQVMGLSEGAYTVIKGGTSRDPYHYELMTEISTARAAQFRRTMSSPEDLFVVENTQDVVW